MEFLKKLFAGGGGPSRDRAGMYFYVRPKRCDEILEVRVDLRNDPSRTEDGGFFVRKVVRGHRCPFPAELHIDFDSNHRITQIGVQDGETVEEEEYQAWLTEKEASVNNDE